MFDEGQMNYFDVKECGLYQVGLKKTHGCELEETFDLISKWVEKKPLANTIPWDPEFSRTNKSKCYCRDIYKDPHTKDYFVVLWKSDTDKAGTLWGASEDDSIGTGDTVKYTNDYDGKKVIWGRPCYYWVIPEHNIVVSIKFSHSVCDAELFETYVKACINNRVQHPNRIKTSTEKNHVRIHYANDDRSRKYSYRFTKKLKSLNIESARLEKLALKVTHIVRRESI